MAAVPAQSNKSAALNLYIYLNDTKANNGDSLGKIVSRLSNDPDVLNNKEKASIISKLQAAMESDPSLCDLTISSQSCKMQGYEDVYACVFTSPDGKDAYMAFRGTGDGRWVDNGIAFGAEDSPIQQRAADYFDEVCRNEGWDKRTNLTVTGHSKGGNLAQYITMYSDNRSLIDTCISMDGQGFSPEAMERFRRMPGYEEQLQKLYNICGENDPVNQFGCRLVPKDHTIYVDQSDIDPGAGGFNNHVLENMLGEDGRLTSVKPDGPGVIGRNYREISDYVMALPPEERESISVSIMQAAEVFLNLREDWLGTSLTDPKDLKTLLTTGIPWVLALVLCQKIDFEELLLECLIPGFQYNELLLIISASALIISVCSYTIDRFKRMVYDNMPAWLQRLVDLKNFVEYLAFNGIIAGLEALAKLVIGIIDKAIELAKSFGQWWNENVSRSYRTALDNPDIFIDTDVFHDCGCRMEALYQRVRQVESILDDLRNWHGAEMSVPGFYHLNSANLEIGYLYRFKNAASYFFSTAERFNEIESTMIEKFES